MDGISFSLEDKRFAAIVAFLLIAVTVAVERAINRALRRLQDSGALAVLPARLLRRFAQWTLIVIVALSIPLLFDLDVGGIWKGLTAILAVIGVGFIAQWSFLSNVLAALIILIWRPFRPGERVEILPGGPAGRVEDINTMFTVLRAVDGSRFAVPNNQFLQHPLRCGDPNAMVEPLRSAVPEC